MTVIESLNVAFLCISIVILVLACLFIIIKIFSFGIGAFKKKEKEVTQNALQTAVLEQRIESNFSSGELQLHNVDERTAVMIIAIVSDESGIPLQELCFKSIRAIENKMDDSQEAIA